MTTLKSKKIAILTQPLISNYGGVLQNFALQAVLTKLGYEVETINRVPYTPDSKIFLQKVKQFVFKHHTNKIVYNFQKKIMAQESQKFINSHIKKVDIVNAKNEELDRLVVEKGYDALVVGSDQVWRPKYSNDITQDFLGFCSRNDIVKISYAASFGTDEWEYNDEEMAVCRNLLQKFQDVSIREIGGVKLCEKYFGIKGTHVLDPTFLLDKEDYLEVIGEKGGVKRSGVFNYVLDAHDDKQKLILKVANHFGCDIFSNHPKYALSGNVNKEFSFNNFGYPSIEGWLAGFRDSKFVVTDSFHGTVFAILFHVPFISLVNRDRGSSRFESLLNTLGLGDRLVYDVNEICEELFDKAIDFKKVEERRKLLKDKSIDFILRNLK